jgi:hypothetical protein
MDVQRTGAAYTEVVRTTEPLSVLVAIQNTVFVV